MIPENINLLELLHVAVDAGKAICQIYKKEFAVEYKDDKSPLTEADTESNRVITDYLEKTYPDIPILSEESKAVDYETRKDWEFFWLVDPLDGTKEFIKKNGEFTVNIALVNNGNTVLGIVYVPVKDILYFGQENMGSYKLSQSSTSLNGYQNIEDVTAIAEKMPLKTEKERPFTVVGSRSHMSDETKTYIESKEREHGKIEILSIGSSLKLCMVAEGKADVYPRFAPTMEWDTAAGHAIVNSSGAEVINAKTNQPLIYNKQDLTNPWFITQR